MGRVISNERFQILVVIRITIRIQEFLKECFTIEGWSQLYEF